MKLMAVIDAGQAWDNIFGMSSEVGTDSGEECNKVFNICQCDAWNCWRHQFPVAVISVWSENASTKYACYFL